MDTAPPKIKEKGVKYVIDCFGANKGKKIFINPYHKIYTDFIFS